jgi:hypothetical protein
MFKDILLPMNISDPVRWEKTIKISIYPARSCGAILHVMNVVPSYDCLMLESVFTVGCKAI